MLIAETYKKREAEMIRFISILLVAVMIGQVIAAEIQNPVQIPLDLTFKSFYSNFTQPELREQDPPPAYAFIPNGAGQSTTYLIDSYFDYMPFSYNGYNVRLQPEVSMPYGYSAGGMYISYHCSETSSTGSDRRAFNSYLNPDGTLLSSGATNQYQVIREGYTSMDIDPYTGNPLFTWHSVLETDGSWDCSMTYDNFHLTGSTGYWKQPWIVMDNPEVSQGLTGYDNDEFNWPVLMIGDSPLEDHRRVHMYGNNDASNFAGNGNYNSLYCYADFSADSLLLESEFAWTYKTFPYMDHLHYDDIDRVNKDMIVKDNKVAFFGSFGDTLFVMYSDDCGENFNWFKQEWLFPIENPLQQDGVTYEFYDNDNVTPSEMFICLSNDGTHYNGTFCDNDTKLIWMTGVNINSAENRENDQYWAAYFYPKMFRFDFLTGTFDFYDIDIQGLDPTDDQPCIPWDLDEDDQVDEYYTDGSVYIPLSMPSWFFNTDQGYQDAFFHESNFKIVANNNWLVAAWHDSKKLRQAYFGVDGYDGWLMQPEMVFIISDDGGDTWSDPLYMNANPNDAIVDPDNHYDGNYTPELADMLPVNICLGSKLEVLSNAPGDYHAKLHFAFFDDNDYGSAAGQTSGAGQLNGGKIRYAALDLEFQSPWLEPVGLDDSAIVPTDYYLSQNYPNPFNPSTTINYSLRNDSDVCIEIFNIKGQKIRTLVDEYKSAGNYRIDWQGKDQNGQTVSSGIYFYKMRTGKETYTRRMVMMK